MPERGATRSRLSARQLQPAARMVTALLQVLQDRPAARCLGQLAQQPLHFGGIQVTRRRANPLGHPRQRRDGVRITARGWLVEVEHHGQIILMPERLADRVEEGLPLGAEFSLRSRRAAFESARGGADFKSSAWAVRCLASSAVPGSVRARDARDKALPASPASGSLGSPVARSVASPAYRGPGSHQVRDRRA